MKKILTTLGVFALGLLLQSCKGDATVASYQIIPIVQSISESGQTSFELSSSTQIVSGTDAKMVQNAEFLAQFIKASTGLTLEVVAEGSAKGNIVLAVEGGDNSEGYTLTVNGEGVTISGASPAGVFYGIQTLRKSIPVQPTSTVELPSVVINDAPRFSYRGVHLDVGRHFYSMDEIKKFIDMMALHNMNRLHWHLTEDQGWRLEIKKYPLLTEIGSKRKETVIGGNSGKYDGKPYGGFYTQDQAREIVKYAMDRHIEVIPEIDLPGHMQAALSAYPDFGCTGGPYEVWTQWGVSDNVLCAGNEQALLFVEDVLAEVIDIFPSKYIHIGGDECPKTQWAKCPKCQAKIKELGIKGDKAHSKEEYLQSYVIKRAEKFLNDKDRHIIGWDEILEGGLSETATVMAWRGEAEGLKAAKMGNNVIMSPNSYLYFDYYQTTDTENEPLAIGGYLPIERVYSYEPLNAALNEQEAKHIVGVQANHWSEYMPTYAQVEYMALPRWAALAEVQWSPAKLKNYENFLERIPQLLAIYNQMGYNYAKHLFDVNVNFAVDTDKGAVMATLSTLNDAPIYYTTDGSTPSASSQLYTEPVALNTNGVFKAIAIRPTGESRVFSDSITLSKSSAKKITANQPINMQYEYNGITTLVDGLKGGGNYKTGRWIAFAGNDLDATIDLGSEQEISSAAISANVAMYDWVFCPRSFTVEVSTDGKTFTKVASENYPAMKQTDRNGLHHYQVDFPATKAKYVRVVVGSERSIPAWHSGNGKSGYLFVDEISIN